MRAVRWTRRAKLIDAFMGKVEEPGQGQQGGRIRADVVHERLELMGYTGDERTTRRAVVIARTAFRDGHRRSYRPWITEPGLWLQFDWGCGPVGPGPDAAPRRTLLFCAWLAWSRFRVVIPTWDRTPAGSCWVPSWGSVRHGSGPAPTRNTSLA